MVLDNVDYGGSEAPPQEASEGIISTGLEAIPVMFMSLQSA